MAQRIRVIRVMIQVVLAIAILLAGGLGAVKLTKMRKAPQRQEEEIIPPLVKVMTTTPQDVQMMIPGYGLVQAKVQVQVVPEVAGKVIQVHPGLVNGGFFRAGEVLLRIDPRDYELAVERAAASVERAKASIQRARATTERAKAAIEQAKVKLDMERAEAAVARQEWQELHPQEEPDSPLVLREPQIRQAQADLTAAQGDLAAAEGDTTAAQGDLSAAQAELATAKLRLERTSISLPFNGRVIQESVDVGQYLVAGQPIASVYGTDVMEIPVPLEDGYLAWFDAPWHDDGGPARNQNTAAGSAGNGSAEAKPTAIVKTTFAGAPRTWPGYVARTEGQVDSLSRMVHVIIEVPKPFDPAPDRLPLAPGMFVEVTIPGRTLSDIVVVPRSAVHNNREVWVAQDDRLFIRPVTIERRDREYAYITGGLEPQTVLVVSPLDLVTDGMRIRTDQDVKPAKAAAPAVETPDQEETL
ncbi:MAG: efflux RND transporter periplasmic adaptor subunit [Sedimentisphaerales bacterium]|nr:efflux RND transporter periplasmic adaptor subunit [Sedimentisphaerales bacterium]